MDSTNPPEGIGPFIEQEGAAGHEKARHAFFATAVPSVANLARVAEPLAYPTYPNTVTPALSTAEHVVRSAELRGLTAGI